MEKRLLQEMRFMMERLESPRMTDTELSKKREMIINEYDRYNNPPTPVDDSMTLEETIENGPLTAKLYNNGIIEICNGNKRMSAYKYDSPSSGPRGFEKIKKYFEENSGETIGSSDIFNNSGIQYSGTLLKILNYSSDECGEQGLRGIQWSR
jgi:hypothetical protein